MSHAWIGAVDDAGQTFYPRMLNLAVPVMRLPVTRLAIH
jgi:hypothetical protein